MNVWLAWSAEVRTAAVAVIGVVLGIAVNVVVSSCAYLPRHFSPWSRRHPHDDDHSWVDRLPVVGWWRLRRKSDSLGRGFWIRPIIVELVTGVGAAALYRWEVLCGGLLPGAAALFDLTAPQWAHPLHFAFSAHLLLGALLLAASLIDYDEMNIPDAVTVPGTLLGLTMATLLPWSLLPADVDVQGRLIYLYSIFPYQRAVPLEAFPNVGSLLVVAGCYWLWCVGLLPRPWRTRHGLHRAAQILIARIARDPASRWIGGLAVVGTALIAAVWRYLPVGWIGLGTSLFGVAGGGAIVWLTRTIGSRALGREAMGFGDVTLMAMIGSFVGWQAAVLIFFSAPAAAVVLGATQWLLTRRNLLPYGPFLCLAAVGVVVCWRSVWSHVADRFAVAWLIPTVLGIGFVLLGVILYALQSVRRRYGDDSA